MKRKNKFGIRQKGKLVAAGISFGLEYQIRRCNLNYWEYIDFNMN